VSRWCGVVPDQVGGVPGENLGKTRGSLVSVRLGAFRLDPDRRQLLRGETEVHLTPKAFDLLALLIERAPAVVPKGEIHKQLWPETFVSEATLAGLVKEVRRALKQDDDQSLIRTAHRVGYAYCGPREAGSQVPPDLTCWLVIGTRRVALHSGANLIGRDPSATVWLDVPGISRRHAQIFLQGGTAALEDLGSKNGTLVGDRPVSGRVTLRNADRIQVATELLTFHISSSGISTATQPRPLT